MTFRRIFILGALFSGIWASSVGPGLGQDPKTPEISGTVVDPSDQTPLAGVVVYAFEVNGPDESKLRFVKREVTDKAGRYVIPLGQPLPKMMLWFRKGTASGQNIYGPRPLRALSGFGQQVLNVPLDRSTAERSHRILGDVRELMRLEQEIAAVEDRDWAVGAILELGADRRSVRELVGMATKVKKVEPVRIVAFTQTASLFGEEKAYLYKLPIDSSPASSEPADLLEEKQVTWNGRGEESSPIDSHGFTFARQNIWGMTERGSSLNLSDGDRSSGEISCLASVPQSTTSYLLIGGTTNGELRLINFPFERNGKDARVTRHPRSLEGEVAAVAISRATDPMSSGVFWAGCNARGEFVVFRHRAENRRKSDVSSGSASSSGKTPVNAGEPPMKAVEDAADLMESGRTFANGRSEGKFPLCMAFSPDHTKLFLGCGIGKYHCGICEQYLDGRAIDILSFRHQTDSPVVDLAFSTDGRYLISSQENRTLIFWGYQRERSSPLKKLRGFRSVEACAAVPGRDAVILKISGRRKPIMTSIKGLLEGSFDPIKYGFSELPK